MKKMLGLILGLALVTGTVALADDASGKGKTNKSEKKGHKGGKKSKKGSTSTTPPPK